MDYIVYDLEFNQKNYDLDSNYDNFSKYQMNNSLSMPFEIIQIGALKLNINLETVSTFNSLIKPTLYKSIHPDVENLTNITNDKVASCKYFIDVYNDFINFIGDETVVLCVWGTVDIKELIRNIKFYNLPNLNISNYIDVQKHASALLKSSNKSRIGLKNAIELLNIQISGEFHDAFNDAFYTAEIFKHIFNNKIIKPSIYTFSPPKRICKPKEKIDMASLITQFEKMYKRQMTDEEVSIIKLAYIMGKTRQFLIKND